ncbi:MAG: hypothetical protein JRN27_06750 [Nitrososphaerota archaeon]|nr:hypothetical protein [Nitrososphaerota archaeon]
MSKGKDVPVYQREKGKKLFLVALMLENKVGAIADVATRLEKAKLSIESGFISSAGEERYGRCSFYIVATERRPSTEDVAEVLEGSPFAKEVEVKEAHNGVLVESLSFPLRWNSGDRAMLVRTHFFTVMEQGIRSILSSGADVVLYQMGYSHGRPSWKALLSNYKVDSADDLQEISYIYSAAGWGRIEVLSFDKGAKKASVKVWDNFEGLVKPNEVKSGCNFVRGHLSGLFSTVFDKENVKVSEVKCLSRGDPACEFSVAG